MVVLTLLDINKTGVDFINLGKLNEVISEIEQCLDNKVLNLNATFSAFLVSFCLNVDDDFNEGHNIVF